MLPPEPGVSVQVIVAVVQLHNVTATFATLLSFLTVVLAPLQHAGLGRG